MAERKLASPKMFCLAGFEKDETQKLVEKINELGGSVIDQVGLH